ncbi:MAG: 4Fe-4S cluster-binding domain-containing protein [Pseudomonadota bacterium]
MQYITVINKRKQGILFNIQRSSIHDGAGVRTVLFFKGCPLRCVWCQNPESQNIEIEYASFLDCDGQSAGYLIGSPYSPEQAFAEIEKVLVFFESTNGGITFSGGEPTL